MNCCVCNLRLTLREAVKHIAAERDCQSLLGLAPVCDKCGAELDEIDRQMDAHLEAV
jgi:hypothetical protein